MTGDPNEELIGDTLAPHSTTTAPIEVTDLLSDAYRVVDERDGRRKVAILVTLAGETEPAVLLMAEPTLVALGHVIETGHLPT